MRILVTGATGFVGQHLLRLLADSGDQVFGTSLTEDNDRSATLIPCDFRDRAAVRRVIQQIAPEHLYHLGGFASVRDSAGSPVQVYETNFLGTLNVLEAVRLHSAKCRVLVVGSGQCYGSIRVGAPAIDETHLLAPQTPYAGSKAAADLLAYQYFRTYGLEVVRVRAFNHAGPGQDPHFVISDLARKIAAIDLGLEEPEIQVGNIRVQRDFSDVRDVVRAYKALMERGEAGEAYNVASGKVASVAEVLELLSKLCSKPLRIVEHSAMQPGDLPVLWGNNEKLRMATGWKPSIALEQTVHDCFFYWRTELASSTSATYREAK
jgi:GDP-4-dehydro-6-deoxy-D-mannose reductase